MPWPWALAIACLDMRTGQVLNWPEPMADYPQNAFKLSAAKQVWSVWNLMTKPKTRSNAQGGMETNWTPEDIDWYAELEEMSGNARI